MRAAQFHVPHPGIYALTHSVGCLPLRCATALERHYLEPWRSEGGDAWPSWLAAVEEFRQGLATILGGSAADYCPQTNLSSGLAKLLPALPRSGRGVLLAAEDSFPSLVFVLDQARRIGLTTRLIPASEDPGKLSTWERALTADVAVVLVTHVHSNTGRVAPIGDVADLCRSRGAFCIVDVAQSAGIMSLDVARVAADAVLGSCVKWLCGGPGAGFLWVNPGLLAQLEPSDVGWFSHEDPFEFDVHSFRYSADARRFWGGTPSVAPYVIAADSLREMADFGVDALRSHNVRLMEAFRSALPARWQAAIDLDRIGGTLCIDLGNDLTRIMHTLRANAVRLDSRGSVARISFHIYNTVAEAVHVAGCWGAG
jgi:kynureninase